MSQSSEVSGQKRDSDANVGGDHTDEASRAPGRMRGRFRLVSSSITEASGRIIRCLRRAIAEQKLSFLFFSATVISLVIAYPVFASAVNTPKLTSQGFVLVLTDDPTISLNVRLQYASDIIYPNRGSSPVYRSATIPKVGNSEVKGLILELRQTGKQSSSSSHRYLAVFSGDAQLKDAKVDSQITTWSKPQAHINFRTMSSTSDIQAYEGEIPGGDNVVQLAGALKAPVMDTVAGKTFVRIPSLGSVFESTSWTSGRTNEDVRSNEVFVAGKKWFKPKSVKYVAEIGNLPVEESIDENRPSLNATDPGVLEWSGSDIRYPQARLSNGLDEQKAQKRIFAAGILAGISGSFLVEGIIRMRRVRHWT